MLPAGIHSNFNFPAPLADLGFLAAAGGAFLTADVLIIALFARRLRKVARVLFYAFAVCCLVYLGLLLGFSLASHEAVLAQGQEKYFCEMDCHLAYSVTGVQTRSLPSATRYIITLRTRFDETTIASFRPRDLPLRPSPRTVQLIDAQGRRYAPEVIAGTPLTTQLIPGESYTTELSFIVPTESRRLRLLVATAAAGPDHLVIGSEDSWLHKKTYFAI